MIFSEVKIAASKQLATRSHCSTSESEIAIAPKLATFTTAKSMM